MFGAGRTLRHPLYVSDAIKGLELAAASKTAVGEVYFIAGEEVVSIAELVRAMAEALGVPSPRLRFPLVAGRAAALGLELLFRPLKRPPPISLRTLDFYTKNNAYDIGKANRDLDFRPRTKLQHGLQSTIAETAI
jgi:nucleoside-diphosphate-sugar epimerase